MVCAQDAGTAVSVAAADSPNGWHSKSILMGGRVGWRRRGEGRGWGCGVQWDWAGLCQTHSATQPARERRPTGGRTLAGKRSHGDWVTTELDQGCGKQHLLNTLARSQSHTHKHMQTHQRTLRPCSCTQRVTKGNLREDWGRQLGTRQFQTNACLYLLASWHWVERGF